MDRERTKPPIEEFRAFCREDLPNWESHLPLTELLHKIPKKSLDYLDEGQPRTIRFSFIAPPPSKCAEKLYYKSDAHSQANRLLDEAGLEDAKERSAAHTILKGVLREEAEKYFTENPAGYRSASIKVGNVTLMVEEKPRNGNEHLHEVQHNMDEAAARGHIVKDSRGRLPNQLIEINNGPTTLAIPESRQDYYPGETFLRRNFHQLVTLANSFEKKHDAYLASEDNKGPLSNVILYDEHTAMSVCATNIIFGDEYLRLARNNPVSYTDDILGHEFGHVVNGDLDERSPHHEAATRLHELSIADSMGQDALNRESELAGKMIAVYGSLDDALAKIGEIDSLFEQITPSVEKAAGHMEAFHRFETFHAEDAAKDRLRNNRFVRHALDIPPYEKLVPAFGALQGIADELNETPIPKHMDEDAVLKVTDAMETLAQKHHQMLDHSLTLRFCNHHIKQGMEILADLHATEVAEDPRTVSKLFKGFARQVDKGHSSVSTELPPSECDAPEHPSLASRIRATDSYAASIMEARRSSQERTR